ncbi:MAG: hypothetical protein KGL39_04675 [Patescibacteria group bacterium]|nr:hypothetical protein [Patescibacteria group bacterium]
MFTVKAYRRDNVTLYHAERICVSYSRDKSYAEVLIARKIGGEFEFIEVGNIKHRREQPSDAVQPLPYENVIVENSSGKTTEIIYPTAPAQIEAA